MSFLVRNPERKDAAYSLLFVRLTRPAAPRASSTILLRGLPEMGLLPGLRPPL